MAAPAVNSSLRRAILSMVALLSAAVALSCSDSLLGSGRRLARVTFQPQFSARDAEIYSSLKRFGLGVTSLHVALIRPGTTDTVAQTTVIVPDGQDEIAVAIEVAISGSEEQFVAGLEMSSGSVLVFSGSITITVRAGAQLGSPPVLIPVWVGPGKEATSVRIVPRDLTIPASGSIAFTALAFDADGAPVVDPEYLTRWEWRVLDATLGTIPIAGGTFVGTGKRGVAEVTVFTPNLLRDTVRVTLVPAASLLKTISGGGQTGVAGSALPQPFVVEVDAADNLPVPNITVNFRIVSGAAALSVASGVTNAQGRAQTSISLAAVAGIATIEASVAGLTPVTITATGVAGAASAIVAQAGDGQTALAGTAVLVRPAVKVTDANGNAVAGADVTFAIASGAGALTGATPKTGTDGIATVGSWTLGALGINTLTASAAGLAGSPVIFTATSLAANMPAKVAYANHVEIVDRATSRGIPATVTNAAGTPLTGIAVTYQSRTPSIAAVDASGTITGLAIGQSVIVVSVDQTALADSVLAVVAEPGGPVLISSIAQFEYGTNATVTVSVFVDMRGSITKVGSTAIDVDWNPAQLLFQSFTNGGSGVVPTVNSLLTSTGKLKLAMADVAGFGGKVEMLRITFKTSAAASIGSLMLSASELNAADLNLTNLLPSLVQVIHPLSVR